MRKILFMLVALVAVCAISCSSPEATKCDTTTVAVDSTKLTIDTNAVDTIVRK